MNSSLDPGLNGFIPGSFLSSFQVWYGGAQLIL